jgi:hypothetical protein
MTHVVSLLYENGRPNSRALALRACEEAAGEGQGVGLVMNMSILHLVHALLHLSSPSAPSSSHPDLPNIAAAVSTTAAACGLDNLPSVHGESILVGIILGERALVQGGVGSFVTAAQLQRLHLQHSSTFAIIKAFYPLAPPQALDSQRLHIAFASKDFGFSSVGQLVIAGFFVPVLACAPYSTRADQRSPRVAVAAL